MHEQRRRVEVREDVSPQLIGIQPLLAPDAACGIGERRLVHVLGAAVLGEKLGEIALYAGRHLRVGAERKAQIVADASGLLADGVDNEPAQGLRRAPGLRLYSIARTIASNMQRSKAIPEWERPATESATAPRTC